MSGGRWYESTAFAVGVGAAVGFGAAALARAALRPRPAPGVRLLEGMANSPFPGQGVPDAAVIVPSSFNPLAGLNVRVYVRGFGNCAANVSGDSDGRCSPGGRTRAASHLASQLERSGANAIVVVPELRFDAASSEPGGLARPGGLAGFLDEVLARLAPEIGEYGSSDIDTLGVMSHSGGYLACAAVMEAGHPAMRSVVLLDSLYAADARFASWVERHASGFSPRGGYRFADVYTATGGTDERSRMLAERVAAALSSAGTAGGMIYDDDARTLQPSEYESASVIFARSSLSHTDVTRYYPERFWRAGW